MKSRLALLTLLAFADPAARPARALPASDTQVSITAREQPVAAFLRDLFAQTGQPVIVADTLPGTVSGAFAGTATKVWTDISRAFGLIASYDGAVVHVYPVTALTSRTLRMPVDEARRIVGESGSMGLSDDRNRLRVTGSGLFASGTPRFVEQIAELSGAEPLVAARQREPRGSAAARYAALPPRPRPQEFRVFYLRFARAEDTTIFAGGREVRVPGLASIMRALVTDQPLATATTGGAPAFGARLVRQSAKRLGGGGLNATPADLDQLPVLGFNQSLDRSEPADGTALAPAPLSTPDTIRIEANPATNSLIIRDTADRMASYDRLVRALDIEPQLVEIEATIVDVNIDKLRRLGINFRVGSGGFGALFGNGTGDDVRLLPNGGSIQSNIQNVAPTGRGGVISAIIGSQREFIARVSALETRGAARIVSRPQVMTLSNIEAVFDRTRTFYVRVAGSLNVDLFNITAGTTLRVNPHVFGDRGQSRIRVLINIEDGNLVPNLSVDDIPVVERASVSTQAIITNGESLLLGGLTVDADASNVDKVPLLGDIPFIGELFKDRSRQKSRSERLFLITPRLVNLSQRQSAAADVPAAAAPIQSVPPTGAPAGTASQTEASR